MIVRLVRRLALATALVGAGTGSLAAFSAHGAPPSGYLSAFSYSRTAPLAATTRFERREDAGNVYKVTFRGAGGQSVPALLMRPRTSRRVPCILGGHQLSSSKEELFAEKADAYASRGAAFFAIDARYHGERAGIGWEAAATRLDTAEKMFRLTVIDMRRGLDYLAARHICDPARIGYEGRSLGGFMGSMLIGSDTRIKAAVLLVSGANWRIFFAGNPFWLGGHLRGARLDTAVRKMARLDPLYWIARARGRPVFMANGRTDEQIPLASALALHRAAKEPKQVLLFDGGHDIEEPHGTRVNNAAAAFLRRYLGIRTG